MHTNVRVSFSSIQVLVNELRQPELEEVGTADPMHSLAVVLADHARRAQTNAECAVPAAVTARHAIPAPPITLARTLTHSVPTDQGKAISAMTGVTSTHTVDRFQPSVRVSESGDDVNFSERWHSNQPFPGNQFAAKRSNVYMFDVKDGNRDELKQRFINVSTLKIQDPHHPGNTETGRGAEIPNSASIQPGLAGVQKCGDNLALQGLIPRAEGAGDLSSNFEQASTSGEPRATGEEPVPLL